MAVRVSLTDTQVRRWLLNFYVPERLADSARRDLLHAHGRPAEGSPVAVAREAQALIRAKIDALTPGPDAPRHAWRPFFVLVVSYLHGASTAAAAGRLALSPGQVTRERTRAIALLRAELETPD